MSYPFLIAPFAAGVGAMLGLLAARDHSLLKQHTSVWLVVLILVAVISALVPNLGQALYDSGLSFPQIAVLQLVSYVPFGFAVTASWVLLSRSPARWLLVLLIPVSFAQTALLVYMFASWNIRGFAP